MILPRVILPKNTRPAERVLWQEFLVLSRFYF